MTPKVRAAAVAAVLVLGGTAALAAPAAAAPAPQPAPRSGGGSTQITLITGDRVTVTAGREGPPAYRVERGAGRKVSFSIRTMAGHTYVVPSDAAPLIGQGLVDRRLFDVTQLAAWRYDDAHRADIPVITQGGPAPKAAITGRAVPRLGLTAARIPKAQAATAWQQLGRGTGARTLASGVSKLWLDGKLSYSLDKSVPQIGAPEAWKQGLTGKGVTVAVLDSGYDHAHPDLKGVVTQEANFSDEPDTGDEVGHGTHVASTVAGSGAASGGKYRGVAPDAKIAFGKVGGLYGVSDSALIAGMEWAATQVKAKVVSISIGGPDSEDVDPIEQAVNELSESTGTLFVIAAGNAGTAESVGSPGSADAALTVGAVDDNDKLAGFSSRGPRVGDGAIKPDITAPGVGIVAANAGGSGDNAYISYSGTSMATPHVSGSAAILAQRHPDWSGARLKAALMGAAKPTDGLTPTEQGTGRVDVPRTIAQQIVTETPNINAYLKWPQAGGQTVTRELTYTNTGDTEVELALATDGPYTLSADRLRLPAGGTGSVTLTLKAGLPTGNHAGTVTATTGDTTVRSLASAYVEPESYDVTIKATGHDGAPIPFGFATIYDLKAQRFRDVLLQDGTGHARLSKGEWTLAADLYEDAGYTLGYQRLTVAKDTEVVLDARRSKQVRFSVDDPAAKPQEFASLNVLHKDGDQLFGFYTWSSGNPNEGLYVLPSRLPGLQFMARSVWDRAAQAGGPVRYDVAGHYTGGLPADPVIQGRRADMRKVTVRFHGQDVAAPGLFDRSLTLPDMQVNFFGSPETVQAPGILTNYVTPAGGLNMSGAFGHDEGFYFESDLNPYPVRSAPATEVWNAAATGPSAPFVYQDGNALGYVLDGLFTDAGAGRMGWDGHATGTATVSRDGKVLGTQELAGCEAGGQCGLEVETPEGTGTYTVAVSARRNVPYANLATAVESSWTFRSAPAPEFALVEVPSVKLAPHGLSELNRARPGSVTPLQARAEGGKLTGLRLEASTDDGTTWRPLPVVRTGGAWLTVITNPRTAGYVSLRATATGPDGTAVKHTITRAYAVQR
ncbi:serine protease [Sphaerisporangium rufum]|uniref:Serine protease n=1 Tax=Sphaerisporangium rufum TaxID=1381558 RepID=A0A919R5N0_9ACTN|nr:S8 family serine peptidase [Sphaerisporangium rufum]GII78745.1 serine protease [Sphaerisporangium rufum]